MALSPAITQNSTSAVSVLSPKVKALAVRTNSLGNALADGRQTSRDTRQVLAEQLNEETKKKYVKGTELLFKSQGLSNLLIR